MSKKSALDDDLDDDGGLDFLKENKPKVNYNDDDDIFTTNKKSNAAGVSNSAATAGPSKISMKPS